MYICYRYDSTQGTVPLSCTTFFQRYNQAKKYALKEAKIIENFRSSFRPEIPPRTFIFYIKIFKIPFGEQLDIHHYELYQQCIETVYDPKTTAAMIIQKIWKSIYNRRFVASVIIKKHVRKAISNPYTQLCKNRLIREFNQLK